MAIRSSRWRGFRSTVARKLKLSRASASRVESNAWLREQGESIQGRVLSIGSGDDADWEGSRYRDYFPRATTYTTSEVTDEDQPDLVLDVRAMPEVVSGSYDCVFCSGVLEHVGDFMAAVAEIHRILSDNGVLLLGLPFRQAIHMAPHDYWRFTEYGIRYMLRDRFVIDTVRSIEGGKTVQGFPSGYWVRARKLPA